MKLELSSETFWDDREIVTAGNYYPENALTLIMFKLEEANIIHLLNLISVYW